MIFLFCCWSFFLLLCSFSSGQTGSGKTFTMLGRVHLWSYGICREGKKECSIFLGHWQMSFQDILVVMTTHTSSWETSKSTEDFDAQTLWKVERGGREEREREIDRERERERERERKREREREREEGGGGVRERERGGGGDEERKRKNAIIQHFNLSW